MRRINLIMEDDGYGDQRTAGWFDGDAAIWYDEATDWDGRNSVSVHTGDQFRGLQLVRTRQGKYALYHWSQWQGERGCCRLVSREQAAEWFARNGNPDDEIPEDLRELVAALET